MKNCIPILASVLICVTASAADLSRPVVALGFENQENTEAFFGVTGKTVDGLHNKGATKLKTGFIETPASTEQGTIMVWLRHDQRPATGTFQYRWIKLAGTQVGAMGGSLAPHWFQGGAAAKQKRPIELGDWHHWAIVWKDGERARLIDGAAIEHGSGLKPFPKAPSFILFLKEGDNRWRADDFMIFDQALTPKQIEDARQLAIIRDILPNSPDAADIAFAKSANLPAAVPVAHDQSQLVQNPVFVPHRNEFPIGELPPNWEANPFDAPVDTDANGAVLHGRERTPTSVLATLKRGEITPKKISEILTSRKI